VQNTFFIQVHAATLQFEQALKQEKKKNATAASKVQHQEGEQAE
jgi:hypothetical protein